MFTLKYSTNPRQIQSGKNVKKTLINCRMFVKIAFYVKWGSNPFDKIVGSHYN